MKTKDEKRWLFKMKNRGIIFTEPNVAKIVDKGVVPEPKEQEVKVKTLFSTVSCGTEKAKGEI